MKVRKKPVEVEAEQYTRENWINVQNLMCMAYTPDPPQLFGIETLEGNMTVSEGDWIIKGVAGEFYPCKPDIFEKTYDILGEE